MEKINCSNVKLKGSTTKSSNQSKFVNTPRIYLTQLNRDPNLITKKSIDQVIIKAQFLQAVYLHKAAEKQLQVKEKVCLKLIENLWKKCDTLAEQLNANKIMLQKYKYYVNELTKLNDMKKIVEPTLTKIRAINQSFSFIVTIIHEHLSKIKLTGLGYPHVPILKGNIIKIFKRNTFNFLGLLVYLQKCWNMDQR